MGWLKSQHWKKSKSHAKKKTSWGRFGLVDIVKKEGKSDRLFSGREQMIMNTDALYMVKKNENLHRHRDDSKKKKSLPLDQ